MIDYIILIISSFVAALISGSAGFGGALILLPVVSVLMGTEIAVPVLTVAQLIGNMARMISGWKQIEWKSVGYFCLTALPLSALGAFGFTVLPKEYISRCIGVALIFLVILKMKNVFVIEGNKKTLLWGGVITGGLSGLVGSGGPIGAAIFMTLNLSPVAYIASEATTATAMHILKIAVYSKISAPTHVIMTGFVMGIAMIAGTIIANKFIKNMKKNMFQKYVAVLLCIVGIYMVIFGS